MLGRLWHRIGRGLVRARWPLAGLAAVVVVLACMLVIPQWLLRWELGASARTLTAADRAKAINDVRVTLLQGIGGAVILLGVYFTYRQLQTGRDQLQIAQQGQVTERFTRAIDQLGHTELDVRLGGIYALERIANDSPDDRATIAEVFTAFVRGHAPWPPRLLGQYVADAPIEQVPELQVRAPDVHAALTVLARRRPPHNSPARLDLHAADLRKAILAGANLQQSILAGANLQDARLNSADLREAILDRAQLQGARLTGANLQDATFYHADLQGARLDRAQLQGARLAGANLQGANLFRAQLQGARLDGLLLRVVRLLDRDRHPDPPRPDVTNLQEANLSDADLQGAHLAGADLQGATLFRAQLQGADLLRAQLQGANLVGADLQGVTLDRAQLQRAILGVADLQGASLVGADLQGATLDKAKLERANLGGASLREVRLNGAQLQNALSDPKTIWPEGFDPHRAGVLLIDRGADTADEPAS
jgi:uncharacterized protein YjbI with pentapeptide repeats